MDATEFGLGRRFVEDARDKKFAAAVKLDLPSLESIPIRTRWRAFWKGNQGNRPACVGYAIVGKLHSTPITHIVKGQPLPIVDPYHDVYVPACKDDEWPGDDLSSGTSVRAGLKIGQDLGYIESYHRIYTFNVFLRALAVEPTVIGINWYESMWEPDRRGLVRIDRGSDCVGGHAICALDYDQERGEVDFLQSYGPEHGVGGIIRMSFNTVKRLLEKEDGDAYFVKEKEKV